MKGFPEPDYIGPYERTAVAERRLVSPFVARLGRMAVFEASVAAYVAVELDDLSVACPQVEIVDILSNDQKAGKEPLQLGEGVVSGIGLVGPGGGETLAVPAPDESGICYESFSCREFLRPILSP